MNKNNRYFKKLSRNQTTGQFKQTRVDKSPIKFDSLNQNNKFQQSPTNYELSTHKKQQNSPSPQIQKQKQEYQYVFPNFDKQKAKIQFQNQQNNKINQKNLNQVIKQENKQNQNSQDKVKEETYQQYNQPLKISPQSNRNIQNNKPVSESPIEKVYPLVQKQQNTVPLVRTLNDLNQNYSSPQAQCLYHPQFSITNICSDKNCLLPLCPQCISEHINKHKNTSYQDVPQIETIGNVYERNMVTIQNQEQASHNMISNLNSFRNTISTGQQFQIIKEKLEVEKNEIKNMLDNYYEELEKNYQLFFDNQIQKNCYDIDQTINKIKHNVQECQKIQQKLLSNKDFLKQVIQMEYENYLESNNQTINSWEGYLGQLQQWQNSTVEKARSIQEITPLYNYLEGLISKYSASSLNLQQENHINNYLRENIALNKQPFQLNNIFAPLNFTTLGSYKNNLNSSNNQMKNSNFTSNFNNNLTQNLQPVSRMELQQVGYGQEQRYPVRDVERLRSSSVTRYY
ncbi:hypothetical protein PPERSA_12338 [Pseudocohnilembus persalinus]|uniref:B box-type domain-containing protein n=1 Tax=Pseudocohnilembus persalinus TaxID=266149 RepID=A0A0V0R0Y3_PSEPJ|nr:hypothetical protein PPERSA_12338 [Pseudocohnilembus persalinus]|eukprot:KRX08183.1 hypothetical protein PPERSA_12338 [Pseudocohnilembus persalinus]